MTYIKLMELAHDHGFQRRVQMAMFAVGKDKGKATPAPVEPDISFINAIIKGNASVFQMTLGVLSNTAVADKGVDATDAELKTAVEQVWPFYAVAGV